MGGGGGAFVGWFLGSVAVGHAATGTAVGGFTGEVMWSGIGIYSKQYGFLIMVA